MTTDNKVLNLYYPTEDDCRNSLSEWSDIKIKSIEQNFDTAYLSDIEEIKSRCKPDCMTDHRGRTIHTLPRDVGYILIRFYCQDNRYLDGLDYQRHDTFKLVQPTLWTLTTPKEFIELFLKPCLNKEKAAGFISLNELKKTKQTKFWNKNNNVFWYDSDGYFYYADKRGLPSKKSIAFHDKMSAHKDTAILARHTVKDNVYGKTKLSWFTSKKEMIEYFKEVKDSTPAYASNPFFEIKKAGYTRLHPNDRRVIYRLPYFDLDTELKLSGNNITQTAQTWCLRIADTKYESKWGFKDTIEEIIKKYTDHKNETKQ